MSIGNAREIFTQLAQLIAVFVILAFTRNEIAFTLVIAGLLLINFKLKYYKNEWLLFLIGSILGFIIEVVLGLIHRMQFWGQGSLFGVPIWLPIVWGCGFVFIRRIGNLIAGDWQAVDQRC